MSVMNDQKTDTMNRLSTLTQIKKTRPTPPSPALDRADRSVTWPGQRATASPKVPERLDRPSGSEPEEEALTRTPQSEQAAHLLARRGPHALHPRSGPLRHHRLARGPVSLGRPRPRNGLRLVATSAAIPGDSSRPPPPSTGDGPATAPSAATSCRLPSKACRTRTCTLWV